MKIIAPLFKLVKLGLGGGAVYLLVDQGLFSHSQKDTIESSNKLIKAIPTVPGTEEYVKKIPKLASKDELIEYWNAGVKIACRYLVELPETSKDASYRGFNYLKEEIQKQMKAPQK